uniref:Uncharacterized protein n=1 Tax=Caenorhabditis japonica TaxID=281687 RepID=A0A8R1IHT9_CAEJA
MILKISRREQIACTARVDRIQSAKSLLFSSPFKEQKAPLDSIMVGPPTENKRDLHFRGKPWSENLQMK